MALVPQVPRRFGGGQEDIAELDGKKYEYILGKKYRWESWAAPKGKDGKLDHQKAKSGPDLIEFVNDRIARALDEAFASIAIARANAEKNLQNARELFAANRRWAFGSPPSNWVETTIGECIRFIDYRGKTPRKTTCGLRLITAKNVKMGYLQRAQRSSWLLSPTMHG